MSIHAVNLQGAETAAQLIFDIADLPVLQDNSSERAQSAWTAAQRDFVILGGDNEEVGRFNLTTDNLSQNVNRVRVTEALIEAAQNID